jgi:hypothetical protein
VTRADRRTRAGRAIRAARKVAVAALGVLILAAGAALIVLPGPASLVIPVGLAVLAKEFAWADRLLRRVREGASRMLGGAPPARFVPEPRKIRQPIDTNDINPTR